MEMFDFLMSPVPATFIIIPLVIIAIALIVVLKKNKDTLHEIESMPLPSPVPAENPTVATTPLPEIAVTSSSQVESSRESVQPALAQTEVVTEKQSNIPSSAPVVNASEQSQPVEVQSVAQAPQEPIAGAVPSWRPSEPLPMADEPAAESVAVSDAIEAMPVTTDAIPVEAVSTEVVDHTPQTEVSK